MFSGMSKDPAISGLKTAGLRRKWGLAENASLTIEVPFEVWMDIMTGKANCQQMFMEQKYRVKGDLSLLMRMKQLFGK